MLLERSSFTIFIFLGRTKVLVATGYFPGLWSHTEIIDLEDASFECTLSEFPESVEGATGGLVGNTVLICGGGRAGAILTFVYDLDNHF